jgi:hypothetical protein
LWALIPVLLLPTKYFGFWHSSDHVFQHVKVWIGEKRVTPFAQKASHPWLRHLVGQYGQIIDVKKQTQAFPIGKTSPSGEQDRII